MSYTTITRTEIIGHFGVDSGTVMVIDPCYVLKDERDITKPMDDQSEYMRTVMPTCEAPFYGGVKLDEYPNSTEMGVVCSTLHGDGAYPVIAEFNSSGKVVRLIIDFDPDTEEEEEEENIDGYCDDCGDDIPWGGSQWYEHKDGSTHYVCTSCKDGYDDEMEENNDEEQ